MDFQIFEFECGEINGAEVLKLKIVDYICYAATVKLTFKGVIYLNNALTVAELTHSTGIEFMSIAGFKSGLIQRVNKHRAEPTFIEYGIFDYIENTEFQDLINNGAIKKYLHSLDTVYEFK